MNNTSENIFNHEAENFNLKNEISYYFFFGPGFYCTIVMAFTGSYTYFVTHQYILSSAQVQITKSDASSSFLTTEVTQFIWNQS